MAMEDSSGGRLISVLISPVKTFQSIAARPTWVAALLVLVLLGTGIGQIVNARTDQRATIQKTMAKFGQNPTEKQLDEAVERASHPNPIVRVISVVVGLLFQAVFSLFPAFLFWLIFKVTGSEMSFKSGLSTYLHGSLPIAVAILLTIPVVLSRATVQPIDALTGGLLASSPAFLAPEGSSVALKAVLASFDVFNLWTIVLYVIGYRIVARASTAVAVSAAVLLFLLGMGVRVAGAAFFG
ncbi:MAG TPA: YIP1 family protein [Thermoanaerobaculia bacterium]|nr:YIP1 family protein [Thermoanaerobaculia bacterium]